MEEKNSKGVKAAENIEGGEKPGGCPPHLSSFPAGPGFPDLCARSGQNGIFEVEGGAEGGVGGVLEGGEE